MNRDLELEQLRLACLDLGIRAGGDALENAKAFYAFVIGDVAKTPRQLIDAALEAANVT